MTDREQDRACEAPLIDLLRNVPADARAIYAHSETCSSNIPYGSLCRRAAERIAELTRACSKMNDEVCQVLGKALGYPWFKDDQNNFPGATEADGVCVGDNVAESMADQAAERIAQLTRERDEARADAERYRLLRDGKVDDIAAVRGLGTRDYGMSAVLATYEEEIDGADLDAAIDAAMQENERDNANH